MGVIAVDSESVQWAESLTAEQINAAREALESGGTLAESLGDSVRTAPLAQVKRVRSNLRDTSLRLMVAGKNGSEEKNLDLFESGPRDEVFEELQRVTGWSRQVTQLNPLTASLFPLLSLVIVLGAGGLVAFLASEAAANVDAAGRHAAFKRMLLWTAQTLGVTGVLVATGVIAIVPLLWTVGRIRKPPIWHDLSPARS
ncbi:MAG: hypothetical protein AAF138_03660 [Planctomycetota bacterium]